MTRLMDKLRDRLVIERAVQTENDVTGGFDRTFEMVAEIWGEILEEAGREQIGSLNAGEGSTAKARVRYTDLLQKDLFLVWKRHDGKSRRFRILSIRNVRYEYIEADLEEVEEE